MEINERITAILSYYSLSVNEFVERTGIKTKQAVYDLLHGKTRSISTSMESKILSCFPDISRAWLLTGEGEMELAPSPPMEPPPEAVEVVEHGTPVYDIDATCGDLSRPITFTDEHIIGHVNLPNVSPNAMIIRANGDSMEPHIHDGDWIAVREVANLNVLYYGQVYLVITNEYRLLKYLRRDEDEQHYVILRSDNKNYDDIRLPKADIRHLFIVENILSLHIKL
jgi:SOS-response transcriptional repressor LexA